MNAVYEIQWTEYERGWGQRPDGKSYHVDKQTADKFIADYNETQPKDHVPDEYSQPGIPKLVEVSDELFKKVKKAKSVWTN